MKSVYLFSCLMLVFSTFVVAQSTTLKAGDVAPDFTAKNEEGQTITLSKFRGKKVVLYFYPRDFTSGCTEQACNLRDNYDTLSVKGYQVIGVSTDDEMSHKNFKDKYTLPFPLVADVDNSINQRYGVWVEKEKNGKKYMGTARTTFVIDEAGVITNIIDKVDTKQHTLQILRFGKL